jgi:PTS system nitrogen regulatory IIA component
MNILNYTRRVQSWQPNMTATSRDGAFSSILEQLCTPDFFQVNPTLTHEGILQALIAREEQRTTAVGHEIAFPHARLDSLSQALFAVVTLPEPVWFDELPVRIICILLVPASEPSISLKIMAQLSRILTQPDLHERILSATTPVALRDIFKEHNPKIDKPIVARDIMRQPRFSVQETDPISTCTHLMSVNNLQSVPVVTSTHQIVGEITVDGLFQYGLPDFFTQLKSVSFIAEFDPFEKYFEDERTMFAHDLMEPSAQIVSAEYTLLEVVFDLTIQRYPKLYVIDEEGLWVGTIDKGTLLDNVINH